MTGIHSLVKDIDDSQRSHEKREWTAIYEHLPAGHAKIVKEFYANLWDKKETQC